MAHAYSLYEEIGSGYKDGLKSDEQVKYPDTAYFKGGLKPGRVEGDVFELETTGIIPHDIDGTFFRVQPDPRFPPMFESDVHFSGDGSVSAFRFQNGHVDWKQRYVQTDRFHAENKHRKALFGRYRNPFTDNEMVKGIIRTVSNTNIFFWRGTMLATKEDGPPFAMDPTTLETIGRYDFDGQLKAPTFTAHPKFDPETGEMVAFAYAAGGDGHDASCDIAVWTFDPDTGKKTEEAWYKSPFCGMIHDAALTKNYLILPLTPLKADLARLKRGGNHWAWDPNEDQWYGVVPRRGGKPEDIKWFRDDNGRASSVTQGLPANYVSQRSMAMLPGRTRTMTAISSWISRSRTETSSSGGRPTTTPATRQRMCGSNSSQTLSGGSLIQRPRATRGSSRLGCTAPTASSRASTTGSSPRSTHTSGSSKSTRPGRTTSPSAALRREVCST